MKRLLSDMPQ